MRLRSAFIYFNVAYAIALTSFTTLFYFKIKIIFLTNFIIISALTLLIIKLIFWYSAKIVKQNTNGSDKQQKNFYRLIYCIISYVTPTYCIIQEPYLVVNHYVSSITFIIVTLLALISLFINFLSGSIISIPG